MIQTNGKQKSFLILSKTIDFLHKLCYNNNCQKGIQYFNHEKEVRTVSARNEKKKLTFEDKFARHFYCPHARLNSIRNDKKQATRKMRRINKKIIEKSLDNQD